MFMEPNLPIEESAYETAYFRLLAGEKSTALLRSEQNKVYALKSEVQACHQTAKDADTSYQNNIATKQKEVVEAEQKEKKAKKRFRTSAFIIAAETTLLTVLTYVTIRAVR
jgi:hypothetical protein